MRGIRATAFAKLLWEAFDTATHWALATGVSGLFVERRPYGVASGLIYPAKMLLFYVGPS